MNPHNNTRSRCRHCDEPIVFLQNHKNPDPDVERNISNTWWHHITDNMHCEKQDEREASWRKKRAEPYDLCMETTSTGGIWGHNGTCYRKVKDAELKMCGIHARPVRDKRAKLLAEERHRATQQVISEGVKEQIEELKIYGIKASANLVVMDWRQAYSERRLTGDVVVNPEDILRILRTMDEEFG